MSCVSISANDPLAIYKNWINSLEFLRPCPSAILDEMDTAALRI